jgi:hypothetical protein
MLICCFGLLGCEAGEVEVNGITTTVPDEDHFVGWLVCGLVLFSAMPLFLAAAVCLLFSVCYAAMSVVQLAVMAAACGTLAALDLISSVL